MREILGRRRSPSRALRPESLSHRALPVRLSGRVLRRLRALLRERGNPRPRASALHDAAATCATEWGWPVVPGVQAVVPQCSGARGRRAAKPNAGTPDAPLACSCPQPDCAVPGGHPFDPVLQAATTDPRMVSWWWTTRPDAPLVLATGGSAPCGLSLPAVAGARALATFESRGVRLGPVTATPTRFTLLVAPYALEELGELLYAHDSVPSSLRFHGEGGYLLLPPSATGIGTVRWERVPTLADGAPWKSGGGTPWLPRMENVLDVLVEASATVPDTGSRLAY
ncbi:bifunctional DNA primase/polymerase [Streptomyces sulphureus]|uniref:bifunctional DNA primase/polymerase n=1 Tax=Streptomyces sulphureus TaxID=47758 RepID=UPI0003785080|nr:bifunctional DNA primase/polymerase [Streptomyces sulphureus]